MSTFNELREIPQKYEVYRDRLIDLFQTYNIKSLKDLKYQYKQSADFNHEWKLIWNDIAKTDGGKISFTTVGIIIGSALGGVGIAAMGGAIGMPLALVLGLGGFLFGTMVDDERKENLSIEIDNELLVKLKTESNQKNISVNDLIVDIIRKSI